MSPMLDFPEVIDTLNRIQSGGGVTSFIIKETRFLCDAALVWNKDVVC